MWTLLPNIDKRFPLSLAAPRFAEFVQQLPFSKRHQIFTRLIASSPVEACRIPREIPQRQPTTPSNNPPQLPIKTLMKTSSKSLLWTTAAVGVTAIFGVAKADAAFLNVPDDTAETPGVLLSATTGLAGTVIASQEQAWTGTLVNANTYQGVLRSMVVDTGTGYDFYYQVINTSVGGADIGNDIFRIAIPGYSLVDPTNPVDATYRTDGLAGLTLDGLSTTWVGTDISNKGVNSAVYSADRDVALDTPDFFGGGAAFDFDPTQLFNLDVDLINFPAGNGTTTAPQNIDSGERSNWLVLRTNYSAFNVVDSAVQTAGGGTGLASTFAPIPEPSTVLFGLAMFGVCAGGRLRKSRGAQ
jgi:hypothetical protein